MKLLDRRLAGIGTCCLAALLATSLWAHSQPHSPELQPPIRIFPPYPWRPMPWPPRPWPLPSRGQELQLLTQSAQVIVQGAVAHTHLVQTFENQQPATVEGTYLLPLPANAAVSNFAVTIDGKRTEAEWLEGDKARDIYEGIVARLRDPAILEYENRNLLRARLFPVASGDKAKIEVDYSQVLPSEGDAFSLQLPQRLPLGGSPQSSTVDIRLNVPGLKSVYSPTNKIETTRDNQGAHISGEWSAANASANPWFSLLFTAGSGRVGLNLITYRNGDGDPYFLLLAAPGNAAAQPKVEPKATVFVLDTSGSMEGVKIEQARKALTTMLGNLNAGDRFDIITFASEVNPWHDGLVTASATTIKEAKNFVEGIHAVGGTDIDSALQQAFTMLAPEKDRPTQVVFMTDGQPTVGETDPDTVLKNADRENGGHSRCFVFGVGFDVNTQLLDSLGEDNGGASDYVAPEEDIEAKVGALYQKISEPVFVNPQLHWAGGEAYDVFPAKMPDLFRGSQTVVFGRIRNATTPGATATQVTMTGTLAGQSQSFSAVATASDTGADNIGRLWATRKVGYLIDDARRNGHPVSDEVKTEIIELSRKFGILTPFTAGLVTDDINSSGPVSPPPGVQIYGGSMNGRFRSDTAAPMAALGARIGSTSGASGVYASRGVHAMRETQVDGGSEMLDSPTLRVIEGKTFALVNGVWTDSAYRPGTAPKPETVAFASTRYFALARDPQTARWLSVGDHVVLVLGLKVIEVVP